MIDQNQVKEALQKTLSQIGVKSYLVLYFDQDKIRFTGEMAASSILPLFQEYLLAKLSGQVK